MKINGYSCISACGKGPESFWKSLHEGSLNLSDDRVFRISGFENKTSKEKLGEQLFQVYQDITLQHSVLSSKLGVILASTKGNLEDVVWNNEKLDSDTLYPVLEYFLEKTGLKPVASTCISNACASSHGALFLAKLWLESKQVDQVLVLGVDEVGPFIHKGFKSLGALSESSAKPFSSHRDGLSLGEAAAGVLVSLNETSDFEIDQVAIETEGHSITRPSTDGNRLVALVRKVIGSESVDAVVAHGTATKFNDLTEDKVFFTVLPSVPITATKWCIGHTLGTSGLMDLIASISILKWETLFGLATTQSIDPTFHSTYVLGKESRKQKTNRVLITSLGFGGMQAAMTVKKVLQ